MRNLFKRDIDTAIGRHVCLQPKFPSNMAAKIGSIKKFDVIVVGGGNAALCAALSAHDHGARVLVLEAASKDARGGNSRFAGCIFRACHQGLDHVKSVLGERGLDDSKKCTMAPYSAEMYRKDLECTSYGRNDSAQTEILLEKSWETIEWMKSKGVQWELTLRKYYTVDNLGGIIDLFPGGAVKAVREGIGLMECLWAAVERAGIVVRYDAPAHDLITSGDTVQGVRIRLRDSYVDLYGQVILACGGFEASPARRRQFLGEGWDLVPVRGCRYNTGTMLFRALNAGAQAVGHWGAAHASPQDINAPLTGEIEKTPLIPRYSYPFGITVNVAGKRFFDEGEDHFGMTYAKIGKLIAQQPQSKAYQIFDQNTLHLLEPRYATTKPVQADTLSDLATALQIDRNAFIDTIDAFNAACQHGGFDPMHKDGLRTMHPLRPPKSNWALPIERGPYVAYAVTCGITFTYGGLASDSKARVLNNEGKPMPGLWCAGEIAGGLFYHNYAGGAGLTKGAVFGRIAGQEAASRAAELKRPGFFSSDSCWLSMVESPPSA